MTFRQVIVPDDGEGVPPHVHDASEVSGEGTFITVRVNRLLAGTINGKEVIIAGGVAGILRSDNFSAGVDGWQVLGDGSAEFNDVTVRGVIIAGAGSQIGFDDVIAGENVAALVIGASGTLESSDFVTGVSGWQILGDGNAEFQDVTVRGVITSEAGSDVDWTHISDVSVGTADIENAAITNAKINDLSADKIDAGTLNADRIAAKTLSFEKLYLGSPDNLIQNPGIEDGNLNTFSNTAAGGIWAAENANDRSGSWCLSYRNTTSQTGTATARPNGVVSNRDQNVFASEGETFHFEAFVAAGGTTPFHQVRLVLDWRSNAGNSISTSVSSAVTPTGSYQKISIEGTAPANTAYVSPYVQVLDDNGGDHAVLFDDLYMRRKVGTLIIEDQAVDIARMLDPAQADRDRDLQTNFAITTTPSTEATATVTVPSFAGEAILFGSAYVQAANNEGASRTLRLTMDMTGASIGPFATGITNGLTGHVSWADTSLVAAPGSTVVVNADVSVSASSISAAATNAAVASLLAVFQR